MNSRLTDFQKGLAVALLAGSAWLFYRLSPMLGPFLCSALLAYLGDPLVDRLERAGCARTLSVILVFALMLLVGLTAIFLFLPALERQIQLLVANVPRALAWLHEAVLPWLSARLGHEFTLDAEALRGSFEGHWKEVGLVMQRLVLHLGQSGQWVLSWLSFLLLVPVVTFYLLRDWNLLMQRLEALLPRSRAGVAVRIAREIDAVLAEFLRGQLLVMLALGTFYSVGLTLAGLDLAFAIGVFAGLVSFVPWLGVIVGVLLAGFAAMVQSGDWWSLAAVLGVFAVGQVLEGAVLSPWLVGDRIGLHPVAVIFAVMAGGQLCGFPGVLLALPVAAAIVVLLRHFHARYLYSDFYRGGELPRDP